MGNPGHGDPMDDGDHGSHCAGVIGAQTNNKEGIAGINRNVEIMALKFLGNQGGSTEGAIAALNYAVEMGAKISSNSWGCLNCYSAVLEKAIKTAGEKNHLFVTAAGNEYNDNDSPAGGTWWRPSGPAYPCNFGSSINQGKNNVICVAATDAEDQKADFSNWGVTNVHLGAPGVDIYSTVTGGRYEMMSGTSMATPAVAGIASMLMGQGLDASQVKTTLLDTVESFKSLEGRTITGGFVDPVAALYAAQSGSKFQA